MHDDGALDLESLQREIDWVIAEGATGVACLAIASEGYKLTEAERDAVDRGHRAARRGRVPVVASADGPGEEPAIDRARRAAERGADALMVLPPYFVKPGPDALVVVLRADRRGRRHPDHAPGRAAVDRRGDVPGALGTHGGRRSPDCAMSRPKGTPQGTTISETLPPLRRSPRHVLRLGRA